MFTEDITERVKAAEAIKEIEQKMKRTFEVAPVGIGILKDRTIVEINRQACKISGYSQKELIGQKADFAYPQL